MAIYPYKYDKFISMRYYTSNLLALTLILFFKYSYKLKTFMNSPINQASQLPSVDYFGIRIPFLEFLGVVPEYAKNGRSRMRIDLRAELENSFHVAHGGLLMTLLDVAMAAAARSSIVDSSGGSGIHHSGAITIDMTVSFMRPSSGRIVVEGSVLKSGKSINYCEAVILNEAGEVVAKSSGTFMLRR